MATKLLLKFGAAVIKEVPVPENVKVLTIGRKPENDIVIDNPAISGNHAKVTRIGNVYFIEDLNSTNGTFIKGKKIIKAELHNSDQVDLAKHSLVFVNDEEAREQAAAGVQTSDKTVVLDPAKQAEMMAKLSAKPAAGDVTATATSIEGKTGWIRIVDGMVDKPEIELTGLVEYIGTGEAAAIKYKHGGGLFAGGAPEIAALISKRPEGYILKAIKEGFPKVNGRALTGQTELKDGDVVEVGKTKMVFLYKNK